jgi:uncharacterized membrane protein YoaK (UPF0700 family)
MFKHHGASRTFYHNFKLAILLSFVSGIVNVSGLFAFGVLTTNVTGHFAFFSEKLIFIDYKKASIFLMFTLFFYWEHFFPILFQLLRKKRIVKTLTFTLFYSKLY